MHLLQLQWFHVYVNFSKAIPESQKFYAKYEQIIFLYLTFKIATGVHIAFLANSDNAILSDVKISTIHPSRKIEFSQCIEVNVVKNMLMNHKNSLATSKKIDCVQRKDINKRY